MKLSPKSAKWLMRFYPPLFFQRIWVRKFSADFKVCEVSITQSILNRNYNGSIYGGSIYSAVDPFYPIMYWQILGKKGYQLEMWLKSGKIDFKKPGKGKLTLKFTIQHKDVENAEKELNSRGKHIITHDVEVVNKKGELCALAHAEVYMRLLKKTEDEH